MKKVVLYLCMGVMLLGLPACGKGGRDESGSQGAGSSEAGTSQSGAADDSQSQEEAGGAGGTQSAEGAAGAGDGQEESSDAAEDGQMPDPGAEGWSEEMNALRQAVVEALGADNYWPDMAMDPQMLEMFIGVTSDMYEDYMAESPMISGNVDTLVIVKAKEGQADAVEETLNSYREANVNDTMQYPQNLGKIQASQVERMEDYVIFVQLGGYAIDAEEEEEVISQCQEANQLAIDAIRGILDKN